MIGRFFYHAFWNFYDYLGTLTLAGAAHMLLALGLFAGAAGIISTSTIVGQIAFGIMLLLQFVLTVLVLAGLLPFCAKAAKGEPARWPDLKAGFKIHWPRVARGLGLWLLVFGLLIVNFFFYLRINAEQSGAVQMALVLITASVGWLILAWVFFATPWLCASSASAEKVGLKQSIAKGLMVIALMPGVWLTVFACLIAVFATGLYTRLGLIFFLPVLASIGQTAYALSVQYAAFLTAAREEMGEGQKLGAYKRRAREMAWDWEHRQPKRTFKELIRPWDY